MDASDTLAGNMWTIGESDLTGDFNFVEDSPNLVDAMVDPNTNISSPSLWDTIKSGISDLTPTLVGAIKSTGTDLFSKAVASAKSQILGNAAKKIAARPDVQAAAKEAAGNKIGGWVMQYWKELALVGLVVLFFVVRKVKL